MTFKILPDNNGYLKYRSPTKQQQIVSHSCLNDDLKTTLPKSFPVNSFISVPGDHNHKYEQMSLYGIWQEGKIL